MLSLLWYRKLVLSYQDGSGPALWFPEDGNQAAELGHLQLMKILKGVSTAAMQQQYTRGFVDAYHLRTQVPGMRVPGTCLEASVVTCQCRG